MSSLLVLVRHGEIVRPLDTSNFDRAPLSDRGVRQMRALAASWPADPPERVYASALRRSIESALVLSEAFRKNMLKRACLREWSPDESGISQPEYLALEQRAWADTDWVPPSGESLSMAAVRGRACLEEIAEESEGQTVAVVGHGTLFSLAISSLRAVPPQAAYKSSIGFAHAALLEAGSSLRIVRDFQGYGPAVT